MDTNRMEAFSDAVIAILITIMVLDLKVPHGESSSTLRPVLPVALSYLLSFVYLAIYWTSGCSYSDRLKGTAAGASCQAPRRRSRSPRSARASSPAAPRRCAAR